MCNPEPLFDLAVACNSVLENMSMATLLDRSRSQEETVKTESEKLFTQSTSLTGMDGNVVFNCNALHVSKEVTKKTQQLVESTNILNRTFLSLIQTAMTSKGPAAVRRMYLNSFLSVVKGLKKSIAALEESLKEEFIDLDVSCWETICEDLDPQAAAEAEMDLSINDASHLRDLRRLATEHLMGESSESRHLAGGTLDSPGKEGNSHVPAEDVKPIASESAVSMTKKLVVKLTPVALGQDSTSLLPKQEDSHAEDGDSEKAAAKDNVAAGDGAASHDASAAALHCEVSEPSNRRSPRLKTTPLRRPSDAKVKASHPAADSDLESEDDSAVAPPTNTEGRVLTGDEDDSDSDSDSVPAALLEAAALSHSSDDDDDSQSSTQVAKQRLFWLAKNTPLSTDKMRHKRIMLGRSSDSGDRRSSGSVSSSDGQDSLQEIQHLNTLRPVGKRPLVQRESDVAARKKRRLQSRVTKSTSHPEANDSSSSSSEDKHDDDDDNDEDDHGSGSESDQKMKPITEEVTLLGSAAFHQSSGETCCDPPWC